MPPVIEVTRFVIYCPTKKEWLLLQTSLPAKEICPVCGHLWHKCTPLVKTMTFFKFYCPQKKVEGIIEAAEVIKGCSFCINGCDQRIFSPIF